MSDYRSFAMMSASKQRNLLWYVSIAVVVLIIVALFLPWTQNIQSKGYVTTRSPQQRPQSIQSAIAGKIEKWYVQEGDFVDVGDTIVFISEIKSEYVDPDLVARIEEQMEAKKLSVVSYQEKVEALESQYRALLQMRDLKRKQLNNKIIQADNKLKMDSADLAAYLKLEEIAANQYERTLSLYEKGLKSLSDLQQKELKKQESQTKVTVQRNKIQNQINSALNLQIELTQVMAEYADKMAKSNSDKQAAISSKLDADVELSKLENKLANYKKRQQFNYITAPQAGLITKTLSKGIGEIVKEGYSIVTIAPDQFDLAAEVYVKTQDIPLIHLGEPVKLSFDGWPALVISGWPEASTGIFDGEVVAIDRNIGENGYYRVLVKPADSKHGKVWPSDLRVGTGTQTFMVLNNVPVWYEIWRKLNAFPPDYYSPKDSATEKVKRKAPIKSVK